MQVIYFSDQKDANKSLQWFYVGRLIVKYEVCYRLILPGTKMETGNGFIGRGLIK